MRRCLQRDGGGKPDSSRREVRRRSTQAPKRSEGRHPSLPNTKTAGGFRRTAMDRLNSLCVAPSRGVSRTAQHHPRMHILQMAGTPSTHAPPVSLGTRRMTSLPPGLRNCTLALKQTRLLGDFLPVFGVRPSKVAQAWRAMHAPSMVPSARADLSAW